MSEIIPAIIPQSFSDLEDHLSKIVGVVPLVQVDILDGKLTPKGSWPYLYDHDEDFEKIMHEEEGMPYWEELEYEFHLMVKDPVEYLQSWISAGAKRIVVQFESFENEDKALTFVKDFQDHFGQTGSLLTVDLGIAINLDTDVSILEPLLEYVQYVQFMGIERIGSQGMPLDERVFERIESFKEEYPEIPVSVDGGITLENAQALVEAGADRLIIGSAIFESDDMRTAIEEFESIG